MGELDDLTKAVSQAFWFHVGRYLSYGNAEKVAAALIADGYRKDTSGE